jgi:uncharacterized membrane protein
VSQPAAPDGAEAFAEGAAPASSDARATVPTRSLPLPSARTPWGMLAFGLSLLAMAGASTGLLFATSLLAWGEYPDFLAKNALAEAGRARLLLGLFSGAGAFLLPALVHLVRRRAAGIPAIDRVGRILCPLALLPFVPALLVVSTWRATPLPYLFGLVAFTFGVEFACWTSLRAMPGLIGRSMDRLVERFSESSRGRLAWLFVLTGVTFYAVFVSYFTLMNHWRLGTAAFDLGINVNWMYNAMHGRWMRTTVLFGPDGGNMVAGHAIFAALFLWLPFFALRPGGEVLLVYQAVIVALAAIPLYKFARTQVPRPTAALVAVAYLFFAPLHGANFYDFHELLPAIFFHFTMYYGIATRRNWLVAVAVVVLFLIREDIPIGLAVVGTFLLLRGGRPKLGFTLALASSAWFVIDKFVVMPFAGAWWFANIYQELLPAGQHGYGAIIKTILVNPAYFFQTLLREQKLIYALHMFAPVAFLPARRLDFLLVSSPGFFFTLMTTAYAPTISIAFQYTTHWVPYLFGGSLLALRWLGETYGPERRRAALVAMCVAMGSHSFVFGAFSRPPVFSGGFAAVRFTMTPAEKERYAQLKELAGMIPREASVAATEAENPHVCARIDCYTLRSHHGDSDFLLFSKEHVAGAPHTNVQKAFDAHPYGLLATRGPFYLFKKNHVSPETSETKTALGFTDTNTPRP